MAEEKHGFKFRELPYFEEMQKLYDDHAMLKLAYIDLNEYLKTLQLKQQQLTAELSGVEEAWKKVQFKKNKTKRTQLEQQLNSNKRKIDNTIEQIEQDGAVLNLASALFIYNEHEVYYLSSGSNLNIMLIWVPTICSGK